MAYVFPLKPQRNKVIFTYWHRNMPENKDKNNGLYAFENLTKFNGIKRNYYSLTVWELSHQM